MRVEFGKFIYILPELALPQTFIYMDLYNKPKVTNVLYRKTRKILAGANVNAAPVRGYREVLSELEERSPQPQSAQR